MHDAIVHDSSVYREEFFRVPLFGNSQRGDSHIATVDVMDFHAKRLLIFSYFPLALFIFLLFFFPFRVLGTFIMLTRLFFKRNGGL